MNANIPTSVDWISYRKILLHILATFFTYILVSDQYYDRKVSTYRQMYLFGNTSLYAPNDVRGV